MFFENGLLLLNREVVVSEILELAALKISGILKVEPSKVKCTATVEDGKLVPTFEIDQWAAAGIKEGAIQEVMGAVYSRLKIDLTLRMRALGRKRGSYIQDYEAPAQA